MLKDLKVGCIADSGQCGQSGSFVDAKCNLDFAGSRSRLAGRSGGPSCLEVFFCLAIIQGNIDMAAVNDLSVDKSFDQRNNKAEKESSQKWLSARNRR